MVVHGKDISMVRGDSETIEINFEADTGAEITGTVEMTVRKTWSHTERLIHKTAAIEGNKAVIDILPADTAGMKARDYVYDVQWNCDGVITTVVPASYFTISEEVTY